MISGAIKGSLNKMDKALFDKSSPGRLVQIAANEVAFVPNALPPTWSFPSELWPLLAEAKQHIGELEGIGSVLPNPAILLRPLEDRESLQSSRLEGTYATPQELLLFELEPKEAASPTDRTNDYLEVFNYRRALHHGTSSPLPLSLRLVRELHEILLTGVRGRDKTPGEFRKVQVAIGATRRFVPPPPDLLFDCLSPLETAFHLDLMPHCLDPLVYSFLVHYQFETIHPFIDGNGRVGRLLLSIMLQQKCGLTKPWLHMSEFFEKHRDEYIAKLFSVSTAGTWTEWIHFCLVGVLSHTKETLLRCRRLLAAREDYMKRLAEAGGSIRLSQIVDLIFHSPFVRIPDLANRLNVTYPTAKSDVTRLVQVGILKELPIQPTKTFYAPEVFDVAYGELNTS
jgi:Fic family protein